MVEIELFTNNLNIIINMTVRFCIFDVGQVCYPYSLEPLQKFLQEKTANKNLFEQRDGVLSFNFKPFMKGEVSFHSFCQALCAHTQVRYCEEIEPLIDEALHKGVGAFFPETLEAMQFLKICGIEICLLSNALPNLKDTGAGLVKPGRAFTSYDLGLLKPDPLIYKVVLQKLGAKPQEVIFIDDKQKNVEAAKSLGILGIVFNRDTLKKDILSLLSNS